MMGQSAVRGRFITLEGIEGVGKSTNLAFMADLLRSRGIPVSVTREPGGVPCSERIRQLLLAQDGPGVPPLTELLLMFAARAAHIQQLIAPSLERGEWVICDRFTDASYAYQGGGRGVAPEVIQQLEAIVQGPLRPDRTLLLDAPWEATLTRRLNRNSSDRFESEDAAFFGRVRAVYLERAAADPQRIAVIDATRPIEEVQAALRKVLANLIQPG